MSQSSKIILGIVIALVVILGGYSLLKAPESGEALNTNTVSENKNAIPSEEKETGPIKFGFIGPLTGDASSIGTVNKAAVEVAVEEVNAEGGVGGRLLEVIYEDGKCNATAAANAANKLINVDKVVAIIGGLCSTETSAFGPMAMEKKVIVFSYASSAPSLAKLGKYFFRSYPSDSFQGNFGAEYAYNTLGARKVAIVYHISEWGTGIKEVFEKRFKELGGEIVSVEGAPQDSRDYRTILTKLKGLNPDLIYFPAYPDGSIAALNQAQELGITTRMLGADAWDDPKMQKEVSGKGNFIYTVPETLFTPEFKAKIKAKTGGDQIVIGTPNAYDNVRLLALVMAGTGTDTEKIQEQLHGYFYNGLSGPISFDANGDLQNAKYVVKKIENGGATEVK